MSCIVNKPSILGGSGPETRTTKAELGAPITRYVTLGLVGAG